MSSRARLRPPRLRGLSRELARGTKHPYGKLAPHGLLSATTASGIIKRWFRCQAPQANLGVVTDRLAVVDVDPRHDGDESFRALEREHGELPLTWPVLSGGGGEHVIFSCPLGIAISNGAAGRVPARPRTGPAFSDRGA